MLLLTHIIALHPTEITCCLNVKLPLSDYSPQGQLAAKCNHKLFYQEIDFMLVIHF